MSTNLTGTLVPLPAPLRILAAAALAAVGVFPPPPGPEELDTQCCTALFLPHDAEELDAFTLGMWQQCGDDPGHDGPAHDSGEFSWADGGPGTVPARPAREA